MKAVMYHYIRCRNEQYPFFKYLDFDNFRRQLDYFSKTAGFISKEEFLDAVQRLKIPKSGVVLTFDDGLVDHYNYAFNELRERELWGIFFISAKPYQSGKLLSVHKIHCLLGKNGGKKALEKILNVISTENISYDADERFKKNVYLSQDTDECSKDVKKILNYYLCAKEQDLLLENSSFTNDYKPLFEFYLSKNQIKEMHDNEMLIGGHSFSHSLMSKLTSQEQSEELRECFSFLDKELPENYLRCYCHPYGGKNSFNDDTINILKQEKIAFSFAVEPRDITTEDIKYNIHQLPRYDCNMFPHGQISSIV